VCALDDLIRRVRSRDDDDASVLDMRLGSRHSGAQQEVLGHEDAVGLVETCEECILVSALQLRMIVERDHLDWCLRTMDPTSAGTPAPR
jgi:hypothetical protein